jgi:tRNA(adenine34) deaminase
MFSNKEMKLALEQARMAALRGEVPVGAVITSADGKVISSAHNMVEGLCDGTAHAEMLVIKEASQKLKTPNRLDGCTLYVTLEPCAMCATAISHARIGKLVYGAVDEKGGGIESGAKIFSHKQTNHKPEIISGVMEEECRKILQDFFKNLRADSI